MAFARTAAVAGSGTVSCAGTTTVTGSGTAFAFAIGGAPALNAPRVGGTITVGGVTKTIVAIASATSLTVDSAFGTFSGQAFTCQTGIIQTGTDTMNLNLGEITGFLVTNRADLLRTFDARGQDLFIEGILTVESRVAQLRNDGSCSNRLEMIGSASGGELIFNGRKPAAANAPFPYPGLDWLGQNGQKIMKLKSTNESFPAKLTIIDACIRYGSDWITTDSGNFSKITTQGDTCWILGARGTGTSQARLRQDNITPSIDFQTTNETFVGVWLNFGVPQYSLSGYTPIDTDGPEVNVGPVAIATKVIVPNYDSTHVLPSYYAGAQWTQLGGAYVDLRDPLKGTNMAWFSQSVSGGTYNVMLWSKTITIKAQDSAGNALSGGTLYYQPVGANVANIRPKGNATGVTFDLAQQTATTVDGTATSIFNYCWDFANSGGLQSSFLYFCTGTTKGAETHSFYYSQYGYDKQLLVLSLAGKGPATIASSGAPATYVNSSLPTSDKIAANAAAISGITFNFLTKNMNVTADIQYQPMYDAYEYALNQDANLFQPDDCLTSNAKSNYVGWTINVATGVTISTGTGNFTTLQAETVILNGTAKIEGLYSDSLGDRILVTNLDPQGFGVSWNIRYKVIGETIWTELSGTGNTALILAETGEYRMQARVAGYTWKEIEFDTSISLAVDLSLQYHVADDGSPQYLKPYNATLVDAFEYNDAAMEVEVTNTTGSIVQPGFPELYQVVEKVQQDPTLVWFWVNPVTTNATSQKVLIPPTSPLRMYLSVDSTASVKITCPVVYSDTGISADDRVKGNPSGFSIILGSSATADSSLIVSQLVEQLGGSGYVTNQNSLKKISDKVETLENYDDTALEAKVDATLKAADYVAPDNTKIDQIKTKVDTLENYDDAALTAKVDATLKAVDYVAPDNAKIAQIKTKVDTLQNYDDSALTAKVDATLKAVDYVAPDNAKIAQIKSIVEDKTGYSLTSAQVEAIAVAVESHLLDEGDGQMLLNAIAQAIGNENIDQIALVAAIRADMERSGGKITQIQTKVDTLVNYDDTALEAKVDATLKAADYVIPDNDTVTIINTKLDELAGDEYDPATDSLKKIKGGLSVVNNGVKKASLEIPHTDSI
jgi:hypothetical protein